MKILPVVNTQNKIPLAQAGKSLAPNVLAPKELAFCATPDSKAINSILNNKSAQWIFKFAKKNPFGFNILALALSCIILRPATIMVLPGQKKDDKQYLAGKSIIASVIIDIARFAFCLPLAKALEYVGNKAKEMPKKIKFPAEGTKDFDMFNFGVNNALSVVLQVGTAALMTMAIPKVMSRILTTPEQKKADCEQRKADNSAEVKNGGAL